jgi:hypothetical protein
MKNPKQVLPDAQHHPIEVQNSVDKPKYIAYPKALSLLNVRLHTTPEEVAAWLFMGPEQGGLAAYLNANELDDPPPKFFYSLGREGDFDYLSPLMGCWFIEENVLNFQPTERYITGKALIERWGEQPGLQPEAYILAKIMESRLDDLHPIYGGTEATFGGIGRFPPLETGLFAISQIEETEKSDFGNEWKAKNHTRRTIETVPATTTIPVEKIDVAKDVAKKKKTPITEDRAFLQECFKNGVSKDISAVWQYMSKHAGKKVVDGNDENFPFITVGNTSATTTHGKVVKKGNLARTLTALLKNNPDTN